MSWFQLFILNSLGYFIGGWVEGFVLGREQLSLFGHVMAKKAQAIFAKSLWGVFYGIGFGAGLGLAFHLCQERTRAALNNLQQPQEDFRTANERE